jgi:hypothetical protein
VRLAAFGTTALDAQPYGYLLPHAVSRIRLK